MRIERNFLMVSNYNADISWILDYTSNYIIYDRSDTDEWTKPFDPKKVIKVPNIGWDIYDKFTYIIDNYNNLPKTMTLAKGNIFKYITKEEFDQVCNNTSFTPLFTKYHKTYLPVCFYGEDDMFNEVNNSWYLNDLKTIYFNSYNDFARHFGFPAPKYLKFAPGSNYIVQKQNILWYPKEFYKRLRDCVSYGALPGEAQIIERCLYTMWSNPVHLSKNALKPLKPKLFRRVRLPREARNFIKKAINIFRLKAVNMREKLKKLFTREKIYREQKSKQELIEYRKKIKIYDIFTYNGEADTLEIRLNILRDAVDQFIIVEAPTTFSGLNKPLSFQEQKERFAPFLDKIKYFVIDDYPNDHELLKLAGSSSNVPKNGPEHWRREFYQKESIKKALTHLKDEDICFIGDVDEIWNPEILIDYKKNDVFKLRQIVYVYYLNNRSSEPWAGTIVTKYKNIKNSCLNHLRTKGKTKYVYVENGGWHFTSMGGISEVRRKLNDSYTKESYNTKDIQRQLDERFGKKDYMGRNFKFRIEEKNLPEYILDNKEKYKELFKSY